jgi:glycine/D-amino acid oxidase-like deaminating enzyme
MDFPEMIRNLQYAMLQNGGVVLENAAAERLLISENNRIVGVRYRQQGRENELACDHCVVTMGAWSAKLLRHHQIELPLVVWKCIVLSYPLELVPCLTVVLDAREDPVGPDTALVPFKGTTLAAESLGVETTNPDDKSIDPVRQQRLLTELAQCFPRISSFVPQAYCCFKTEYRTTSGVPDVGSRLYDASEQQMNGLTVAIPGKASLAFELAAQVRNQLAGTA